MGTPEMLLWASKEGPSLLGPRRAGSNGASYTCSIMWAQERVQDLYTTSRPLENTKRTVDKQTTEHAYLF